MAAAVRAATVVALAPEGALRLWTDVSRWSSFVEGFQRTIELSGEWPAEGARVVWESGPSGRGRVTEKVSDRGTARFATQVFEEKLNGRQEIRVSEHADGALVEAQLEYELARGGPLSGLTDVLFIRRAQRDALRRTLRRFAVEAEDEAGLR